MAISWHGVTRSWAFGEGARLTQGGSTRSEPIQTMSVTKSVVGLVMGRLVTLGKLASIEEPVHSLFPEWRQGRKKLITVRMLLEHTSGLQNVPMTVEEIYPSPDFVQLALAAELAAEPGTAFAYNNKAVNLLAGVVQRADGRKLDDFARQELLRPLGIADSPWLKDDAGNPHAMSGLALHAADLVRLGQLVLNRGEWNGTRLIDESWFDAMDQGVDDGHESALMWWHFFDTRISVTGDLLAALEHAEAEADVLRTFAELQGEHRSPTHFFMRLNRALGAGWRSRVPAGVTPFEWQAGGRLAYRAEGDLGQYVYAFPGTQLVAARLVRESTIEREVPEFRTPPRSLEEHLARVEPFLFPDFEELLLGLNAALENAASEDDRESAERSPA